MARARNIKPGFFLNEDLAEMEFGVRLLFIGLWTVADRRGRLQDRPKKIKMSVFPADSIEVEPMLDQLHRAGLINRYESCGIKCIQIVKFEKHQNPHKNEAESQLPESEQYGASTVQAPEPHGANHADSLIPDSLIRDSTSSDEEESPAKPDDANGAADKAPKSKTPPCPAEQIVDEYHRQLPELPAVAKLTSARRKALQARWREREAHQSVEFWIEYFADAVRAQPFLMGVNQRGWRADFEWLIRESNFYKTVEGKYAQS